MMDKEKALSQLRAALGHRPLDRTWARIEILLGLLATGLGLLLGDWLKRVMVGVDLSPDLNPEVRQSRFFAQYAPSRPLALDRPADLPDTSLAQAFRADSLTAAGQSMFGLAV